MLNLAGAAVFLLAIHLFPSTPMRPWAIARLGKTAYLGVFSAVTVVALVWLIRAFDAAPAVAPLWIATGFWRYLIAALMVIPFIMLVAGLTSPNPSMVGRAGEAAGYEPWRGINAVTRHPVFWAIGIWGLLHFFSQPNAVTLLFFGTFALLAIGGAKLQELRKRKSIGDTWKTFEAHTSFVPFAAIMAGRAKFSLQDIGFWRIAAGVALWAVLLGFHGTLFGVPVV